MADLREAGWQKRLSSPLRSSGKTAGDASRDSKSAPREAKIARGIRATSAAANAWIAGRLAMGHPTRVGNLIREKM